MDKNQLKMANYLMNEAEEEGGIIKIYYNDLDLESRAKVLKAIDDDNDMIDVFGDEHIKTKIIKEFSKVPLFAISGKEIVNKMNFDF